jgi:phosphoenolpyruvate phosphomutase
VTILTGEAIAAPLFKALARAGTDRRPLRAIGAASAAAARVAADAGFDALWVSGLEVSTALGLPDENVLGPRDLSEVVLALGRTTELPVIVDVDNAGGSTATARRFADDLTHAGAAGLCLEDSAYPKCNSFSLHRSQQLAPVELIGDQLAAMRSAAGPQTLLVARTEALICGSNLADALARGRAYAKAGADAILVHSKDPTGGQALATADVWGDEAPLVTVPTAFPQLSQQVLGQVGFALVIYANQLSRAALAAMRAAAGAFTDTGSFTGNGVELADVRDLLQVADPAAQACL